MIIRNNDALLARQAIAPPHQNVAMTETTASKSLILIIDGHEVRHRLTAAPDDAQKYGDWRCRARSFEERDKCMD